MSVEVPRKGTNYRFFVVFHDCSIKLATGLLKTGSFIVRFMPEGFQSRRRHRRLESCSVANSRAPDFPKE